MHATWEQLYRSELQGVWALIVLPALFLLALPWLRPRTGGADPRAAGFVRGWAALFAAATVVDPPAIVFLGVPMLPFVLLGDFRVFLLVLGVAEPERALGGTVLRAAAWTLVVPVIAWSVYRGLQRAAGPLPEQVLWLVYESAFCALALWWRGRLIPARRPVALRFLRAVLAYVAAYYGLWVLADLLILGGRAVGWAVRVVPNQLYYACWVPVVWALFFSRRYASTRSIVQARR